MATWMVAGAVCDPLDSDAALVTLVLDDAPYVVRISVAEEGGVHVSPGPGLGALMERVFDDRDAATPEEIARVDAAEEAFSRLASTGVTPATRLLAAHLQSVHLPADDEPSHVSIDPSGVLVVSTIDTGDSAAKDHVVTAGPLEAVLTALVSMAAEGRTASEFSGGLAQYGAHTQRYTTYYK